MSLTSQQERFCREYAVSLNGPAAYRLAYPKARSNAAARAGADRLLKDPKVLDRITALQHSQQRKAPVTPE